MKHRAIVPLLFIIGLTACNSQRTGGQIKVNPKTPLEIISNKKIWGPDFPLAIAYLKTIADIGEKSAEVFPEAIWLTQKYTTSEQNQAQQKALVLTQAINSIDTGAFYKKLNNNLPFQKKTTDVRVLNLPQIDSITVSVLIDAGQLFVPSTTIATIQNELGDPEFIRNIALHAKGEELPETLKLYSYGQGSILFAESNRARTPGLLNRVYFNLPALINSLNNTLK